MATDFYCYLLQGDTLLSARYSPCQIYSLINTFMFISYFDIFMLSTLTCTETFPVLLFYQSTYEPNRNHMYSVRVDLTLKTFYCVVTYALPGQLCNHS